MNKNNGKKKNLVLTGFILMVIMITSSFMIFSCGSKDTETASETTKAVETVKETKKDKETKESKEKEETTETATKAKTNSTKSSTKATTKSTKSTTKATQAAKVCYITIEGYCSNKQITLKSGDTVYDILKRSGASVSAKNTGYGIYIEGINGRYEFDEGPTSGWLYYVNGTKPNESCNKYSVGSGDSITWDYVDEV